MKAVVAAFNQEKALVGAFSVITNLRMELFGALEDTGSLFCPRRPQEDPRGRGWRGCAAAAAGQVRLRVVRDHAAVGRPPGGAAGPRGAEAALRRAPRPLQVSCDWWTAGLLTSDWCRMTTLMLTSCHTHLQHADLQACLSLAEGAKIIKNKK